MYTQSDQSQQALQGQSRSNNEKLAPQKRSRRALWITISILGVLLLMGAFVFNVTIIASRTISDLKTSNQLPVADRYYWALLDHNYSGAYAYLDSHATIHGQQVNDEQTFVAQAQAADRRDGSVMGVIAEGQQDNTGQTTLQIHRGNKTYEVHLQLRLEGNDWKIVSADSL